MDRVYLDHAATSWPKPEAVYEAVDAFQRGVGSSAGRGSYASARQADTVVADARRGVAQLLGETDPSRVVFTTSGTDSLSTAILGVLRGGEHVVSTVCEHNAVLRPLAELASSDRAHPIRYDLVGCGSSGRVDPQAIAAAITDETRLVVVGHASNVTGVVQDVSRIADVAHQSGAMVILDAAQTIGKLPAKPGELGVDLLAAPGHKGMLGPQGVGVLWFGSKMEERVRPLRYGGVAIEGAAERQPSSMPHRYEAGTLNVPAIAGLGAGVAHLLGAGLDAVHRHVSGLTAKLIAAIADTGGCTFLTESPTPDVGVVSFNIKGYDPHEAATLLEQLAGVECRAGLHCAPRLHAALGSSGAVRLSLGPTTTPAHIDAAVGAIRELAGAPVA